MLDLLSMLAFVLAGFIPGYIAGVCYTQGNKED